MVVLEIRLGSPRECGNALAQYGIDFDQIPIKVDGSRLKLENHSKFLKLQYHVEGMLKDRRSLEEIRHVHGMELPLRRDILLGRPRIYHQHEGNSIMRKLVEELLDFYNKDVSQRQQCIRMVLKVLQKNGARFLEKDTGGWWRPVKTSLAEEKIATAFRTLRSIRRKRLLEHEEEQDEEEGGRESD